VHQVVLACGSEVIGRQQRSYEREELIFDPLHYPIEVVIAVEPR
jgi:hypothetical protein